MIVSHSLIPISFVTVFFVILSNPAVHEPLLFIRNFQARLSTAGWYTRLYISFNSYVPSLLQRYNFCCRRSTLLPASGSSSKGFSLVSVPLHRSYRSGWHPSPCRRLSRPRSTTTPLPPVPPRGHHTGYLAELVSWVPGGSLLWFRLLVYPWMITQA
jgi:hypothetical protein